MGYAHVSKVYGMEASAVWQKKDSPGARDAGYGLKNGIMSGRQIGVAEANFERGPYDG